VPDPLGPAAPSLRAAGALGADQAVATERGERFFPPGDQIMLLRNERGLGVKNGTLGTVERVEGQGLTVRLATPAATCVSATCTIPASG